MRIPDIKNCPGTLAAGYETYSTTCLRRMFNTKRVSHILPYNSPATSNDSTELFISNQKHFSISGVQEKFSVLMDKNKLRLTTEGEWGTYILKPIPIRVKKGDQMPANEHLTMQIARQVFDIESAENALIFFRDGEPAYITKRFDVKEDGNKLAKEDFASLAGRTPQTHGEHYKYIGSYLDLFELMKKHIPAYSLEAMKLFKLLIFNYLFSNGDAHIKNFSILETPAGDHSLSPAYDLLNTRIHIDDSDFALDNGLLPRKIAKGKIIDQFRLLSEMAGLNEDQSESILKHMLSETEKIEALTARSYLNEKTKRNYLQAYKRRHKKLSSNA